MNRRERKAWAAMIRDLRRAAGLDQEELAQQANTTRRTVGSIERGQTVPQQEILERLLAVLGVTWEATDDPDIERFLALIAPLLRRLSPLDRQRIEPQIVRLIVAALGASTERGRGPADLLSAIRRVDPDAEVGEDGRIVAIIGSSVVQVGTRAAALSADGDSIAADDTPGIDEEAEAPDAP